MKALVKKSVKSLLVTSVILAVLIYISVTFLVLTNVFDSGTKNKEQELLADEIVNDTTDSFKKYIKSEANLDTSVVRIHLSDPASDTVSYKIDQYAGRRIRKIFSGRRINISITGVDSRLGSRYKHADANHVLSILLDSAKIEIISVPRDTEADAGQEDTTQNKLTIVRAAKGRQAYLNELARIAELDKIHYWVELGFSQAMGILEFLGFKNSGSALQVLRSRSGKVSATDYQRHYNQGQFIRQGLLKHFDKLTGFWGDILIRGGLALVETNITASKLNEIFAELHKKGFPRSGDDIVVKVRPPIAIQYKQYDFNEQTMNQLSNLIENYNSNKNNNYPSNKIDSSNVDRKVEFIISKALGMAMLDSAKRPLLAINKLKTLFDQRAWMQVPDLNKRDALRDAMANILFISYMKLGKVQQADAIRKVIVAEENLRKFSGKQVPKIEQSDIAKPDTNQVIEQ